MSGGGEGVCEGVRWTGTCRWLAVVTCVVVCWSGMAAQVTAQTCTTVANSYLSCEKSGAIKVSLSCPDNYIIKVLTLSYRVAATPACPAEYSGDPPADHCLVSADPDGLQCNWKTTCTKDVVQDTSGTCGGDGAHYIRIVYYCEPLQHLNPNTVAVTSMKSMAPLSGLQVAYINSDPQMRNRAIFTDTSLGCIITIPANTQVIFQVLKLVTNPPQSGCNQKIQFWDGVSYAQTICDVSATDVMLGGCDVNRKSFYIKYLNSDPSIKVSFTISVAVSHRAAGVDMRCGLQVAKLPEVVTTTVTTPTPRTQAPGTANSAVNIGTAPPQDEQSLKLIIILVSVAVSLIIGVIIIGVIIKKCSRKSSILNGSETEDLTDNKRVFNYVRNIYLHGENSSKLVMDRRRSSTPSSASMALRV